MTKEEAILALIRLSNLIKTIGSITALDALAYLNEIIDIQEVILSKSPCACEEQKAKIENCQEHIWRRTATCDLCGADFEEVMGDWVNRAFSKEPALPAEKADA